MARKTKEEALRTRQQIIDAAREVFHKQGVAHTSLAQVAKKAGVTRGAVYWHFKDKVELFFAMREDVFVPITERIDSILFADGYADPIDAIEAALKALFEVLEECPELRQVFEVIMLRCEVVHEYAEVQAEANRPSDEFLQKIDKVYKEAAEQGYLRKGLEPSSMALDTWAFASGLLYKLLSRGFEEKLRQQIPAMIVSHMALRRPD